MHYGLGEKSEYGSLIKREFSSLKKFFSNPHTFFGSENKKGIWAPSLDRPC